MVHALVNSPNLGNLSFALSLTGARVGNWPGATSVAVPAVRASCSALCGPLFTRPRLG